MPADDDEPSEPVRDAQTALLDKLGETLHKNRSRCLSTLSQFAEECDTSVRNVVRCMHALAETLAVNQEALLHNFLRYVSLMQQSGVLRPILFAEHIKHDETQTFVIAKYPGCEQHAHKGKIHVIQHQWTALIEICRTGRHLWICGSQSPKLKLSANATGETNHKVLECSLPSFAQRLPFQSRVKILETDEGSANLRCQNIMLHKEKDVSLLTTICSAHKTHAIGMKTWTRFEELQKMMIKTLRLLHSPGAYAKFVAAVLSRVDEVEILRTPLPPEAVAHRAAVIELFSHREREKPKSASMFKVLTSELLSGDWRVKTLQHLCVRNCCANREHTKLKLREWLPKLLRSLQLSLLNK